MRHQTTLRGTFLWGAGLDANDAALHPQLGGEYGPEATVDSVDIKSFEEQSAAVEAASELGRKIAEALETVV